MDTNGDGNVDYEEFANFILRNKLTRSASFEELATTTTRRVHKCLLAADNDILEEMCIGNSTSS